MLLALLWHSAYSSRMFMRRDCLQVPVGTFFRDATGTVVADLQQPGDSFLAARGGAGGKGNYFFLTNENRAPTTYEEGGQGEDKIMYAELRAIADVGMVC